MAHVPPPQPHRAIDRDEELHPMTALLELADISKSFPGVKALQDVHFSVREGEVHALVGENGAGKSTLIKVVSGVHHPDSGTIRMNGEVVRFDNPHQAQQAGIATMYQELSLYPELSVAENMFMGHAPMRKAGPTQVIDWGEMYGRSEEILASLNIHNLDVRVHAMPFDPPRAVLLVEPECRRARVPAVDERRVSADPHKAAPCPRPDQLAEARFAEPEREVIPSRSGEPVYEHAFRTLVRIRGPWETGVAITQRPVVGDRPVHQLDEPRRNLTAPVPAFVDD